MAGDQYLRELAGDRFGGQLRQLRVKSNIPGVSSRAERSLAGMESKGFMGVLLFCQFATL